MKYNWNLMKYNKINSMTTEELQRLPCREEQKFNSLMKSATCTLINE